MDRTALFTTAAFYPHQPSSCACVLFIFSTWWPRPEVPLHACLTLSGPPLQHSVWINNSSRIVKSDYTTSNGVIHYVDKLLTPYALQNVTSHQLDVVQQVGRGQSMQRLAIKQASLTVTSFPSPPPV